MSTKLYEKTLAVLFKLFRSYHNFFIMYSFLQLLKSYYLCKN